MRYGVPGTGIIGRTIAARLVALAFPRSRVVKSLNTVTAAVMVNRAVGQGDHSGFLSGNDAAAKSDVANLLRSFGWKDIVDLGDISTARGVEMYLPIWVRLWSEVVR